MQRARQVESEETETLNFQSYDSGAGVEHIEIRRLPDGHTVAEWRSKDLLVRLAAQDLLEANLLFIGWIESGERGFPDPDKFDEAAKAARDAIAKATA